MILLGSSINELKNIKSNSAHKKRSRDVLSSSRDAKKRTRVKHPAEQQVTTRQ